MENTDKRIDKLNKKIKRNMWMEKHKYGKGILAAGVGGLVLGIIDRIVVEFCGCETLVVPKAIFHGSEFVAGGAIAVNWNRCDKRREKYINELHGYALEENKAYTKKISSRTK